MKLTVQELGTIIEVMNIRSNRHSTIKDLRLLDSVVQMLLDFMPKTPELPVDATDEQKAEYEKEVAEYPSYEVEINFMRTHLDVIKNKMNTTNVFFDDKTSREKILALAEKIGL